MYDVVLGIEGSEELQTWEFDRIDYAAAKYASIVEESHRAKALNQPWKPGVISLISYEEEFPPKTIQQQETHHAGNFAEHDQAYYDARPYYVDQRNLNPGGERKQQ